MAEAMTANDRVACRRLLLALLVLASTVSGHRLDEYLQATLVTIESDEIRLHNQPHPPV